MINLLVFLLILIIVMGIVFWVAQQLPIPGPWKNIALAIIGLIFVIWLLGMLLGYSAPPTFLR